MNQNLSKLIKSRATTTWNCFYEYLITNLIHVCNYKFAGDVLKSGRWNPPFFTTKPYQII